MKELKIGLLLLVCFSLSVVMHGCSSLGDAQLRGIRTAYNVSVQGGDNEELLLNLVRLRYNEAPTFLRVGSITSSMALDLGGEVGANFNQGALLYQLIPRWVFQPRVFGNFSQTPTTTYKPLKGEQYMKDLLAEIELDRLWYLLNSGWKADLLLGILVKSLDDFPVPAVQDPIEEADRYFYDRYFKMLHYLSKLQARRGVEFFYTERTQEQPAQILLELRLKNMTEIEEIGTLFTKEIPYTQTGNGMYIVTIALVHKEHSRITSSVHNNTYIVPVKLRSFLEVLSLLSWSVDIPEVDIRSGIAVPPAKGTILLASLTPGVISVKCDYVEGDVYIAANYKGNRFYVADNDLSSKKVFAFLGVLYSLQVSELKGDFPVLTLPVKR